MPRQLRIQYPGAMYHVMSRGNRRQAIFLDDVDRQQFLKTLAAHRPGWLRVDRLLGEHGLQQDGAAGQQEFDKGLDGNKPTKLVKMPLQPSPGGSKTVLDEAKRFIPGREPFG